MYKSRLFFKIVFFLSVGFLLLLIAAGLANIISYFSQGADRADALNVVPDLPSEYTPQVTWLTDDVDTGRPMEYNTRNIIEKDYIRALYQRNIALLNTDSMGVKEYFTKQARQHVFSLIANLKKEEKTVQLAEMNHNIKLHFYSADGQIVAFTDHAVEFRERYYNTKAGDRLGSDTYTADLKVVMILKDGAWKIEHLTKAPVTKILPGFQVANEGASLKKKLKKIKEIKGINYYPQETPWKDFWLKYDTSVVDKDMALIKSLGFNGVRVFVNYEQFGKGHVVPEMIDRLDHFLNACSKSKLNVVVTLFDFNSDYRLLNFTATDRQLETLLTRFKDHPALMAWDIKNEPDLDYFYQNESDVREWLRFMVRKAKKYDPATPITIGWAKPQSADFLAEDIDYVSFHYYEALEDLETEIVRLRSKVGEEKLLVLEEFGLASYQSIIFPLSKSQNDQARHFQHVCAILKENGNIPYFYWTLYDFGYVASDIAGNRPWQRNIQKHFGMIDQNGEGKTITKVMENQEVLLESPLLDRVPSYLYFYVFSGVIFALVLVLYRRYKN